MDNTIELSVVIPTRNRSGFLNQALLSLTRQTYPAELFEVIVIDNGSTDSTRNVVEAFSGQILHIRYCFENAPGLHVGRHRGFQEAKGDIIVYADDDVEAFPSWLEGVAESFKDKDVMLVGGKNLPKFETDPPDWLLTLWSQHHPEGNVLGYLSILDFGDSIKEINPKFIFGCNFSIRKPVLFEAGGFHPDAMPRELIKYRGDGETYISEYVLEKKYKALYSPRASVFHYVPKERMTVEYFQYRAYIQGISDSFTQARDNHRQETNRAFDRGARFKEKKKNRFGVICLKIFRVFKQKSVLIINKCLGRKEDRASNKPVYNKLQLEKFYKKGFHYHQDEIQKDQKLLSWVIQDNYLGGNAKLPGWGNN